MRPPASPALPMMWTRKQVAASLQISERHLLDLEKQHGVPILRAGAAVRYDKPALDHLIGALRARSISPEAARDNPSGAAFIPSIGGGYEKAKAALKAARERNKG